MNKVGYTVGSVAVAVLAAIACSSSPSSGGGSCASLSGICSLQFTTHPGSPSTCPPGPTGDTFAVNAGATSYTTVNGGTCSQSIDGCHITRSCGTDQVDVTFTGGAYAGTFTINVSGTNCEYDVLGGNCSTTGPGGGSDGGVPTGSDASGGGDSGSCARPCGNSCCSASAVCISDSLGNKSCAEACTDSKLCPSTAPCCDPTMGNGGACVPSAPSQTCRCTTGAGCPTTGTCAPQTDVSGNPVGPYVCKANDGAKYDGCGGNCLGTGRCPNAPTGYSCFAVTGNSFCGKGCTADADCGDPGVTCCKPATCGNCVNSCSGAGVCGPC
jgi:hypothetical protein